MVLARGQQVELQIIGSGFIGARELVFYQPGIRCMNVQVEDEYSLTATLAVDSDCAITSHAFRLLGEEGFSELRSLRVAPFPVQPEGERDSVDEIVELSALPRTILGVLNEGEYDRYAIELTRGQRLTVEVDAIRLGGQMLDTILSIVGPEGEQLAIQDDGPLLRQDPTASFVAEKSGRYVVEVRETNYSGSPSSYYALHVGHFPPAGLAYPAGGQLGTTLEVQWKSATEVSAEFKSQQVKLPQIADGFQLFVQDEFGKSASCVPFRLSSFPNVLENEPNDSFEHTVGTAAIPIAFNGILQTDRDVDVFGLEASQGQALRLQVFAEQIGSPADTYLELHSSGGQLLAQNDDWGSQDSRIEFTAPYSGSYFVSVRDKLGRGSTNAVYRIEVTQVAPQLTAFLPRPDRLSQKQQTISVPQGNRTLARIGILRENLAAGDYSDTTAQISFVDLPAGVHASPILIGPDDFWALAIVEAAPDAELSGRLVTLTPVASIDGRVIEGQFRQVVDLIAESADRLYEGASVDRLAISVTPPVPFSIDVSQPEAKLAVGGSIDLTVRMERNEGFDGAVRIEFPFLPDGCFAEPFAVIEPGSNEVVYRLHAEPDAKLGEFKLAATAQVQLISTRSRGSLDTGSNSRNSAANEPRDWSYLKDRLVASRMIDLQVGECPITGDFDGLAAEQGQQVTVRCKLGFDDEVPEQFTATLEGLPNRVTTGPVSFESSADELSFELNVPADAPLGTFSGIQCRLSGKWNSTPVSFVVESQVPLMIAEPGKLHRSDDGRVLSPLEALRREK
ncbi:MAG: PPC domain-containing protein [bacterium]|nr:PPC domain-containing protein [bacterium]